MTSDLRKLLIEAREYSGHSRGPHLCAFLKHSEYKCDCGYDDLRARIDAALAEKVEPVAWAYLWPGKEEPEFHRVRLSQEVRNARQKMKVIERPLIYADAAPADQWRRVEDGLPEEVVGHKTLIEAGGVFRHEPLTRGEADKLEAQWQASEKRRNELMPDEHSAIEMFFDAHYRLKNFGWKDACYCPKDGSSFLVIEAGSTGQHTCIYQGEWPKGSYWIQDPELGPSPSKPVLFKPLPALPESDK